MTTFRELEALVAVVDMGSFMGAARSLNTSQSAVSRLIQEFEAGFAQPLFVRNQRSTKLTMEGQEVLRASRAVLRQRATLMERFCSTSLTSPTLRFGVTEIAAITWLPRFVEELRLRYPRVYVEVEVNSSSELHARVRDGKLDIALVIDVVRSEEMVRIPIGTAQVGWYCAPGLLLPEQLSLSDLEHQTLLIQGSSTGSGSLLSTWFVERSVWPASVIHSDSLMALSGMAAAGLGLANLPKAVAQEAVLRGALKEVRLPVNAPELNYVALVKIDSISDFHRSVIAIAQGSCDFGTHFHSMPAKFAPMDISSW
jgi:DNA-binding transcriptional LysR family regulator